MTGFPWIDACMRQLIQEGWIHHVCRNSLAIFLTRGDLFISWEKGMNSFFKYLIDVKHKQNILLNKKIIISFND
jgi:cryptochrome